MEIILEESFFSVVEQDGTIIAVCESDFQASICF